MHHAPSIFDPGVALLITDRKKSRRVTHLRRRIGYIKGWEAFSQN